MSDKPLDASFEEMTVSPTPGSPLRHAGGTVDIPDAPPKDKITFLVEILCNDHTTKKSVRILPTSSMYDFLDKLTKKKYLPSASALGGQQLKNDHMSISFGKMDYLVPLARNRWAEPLWNIGFRDKDNIVIKIDPNQQSKTEVLSDTPPDSQSRKSSEGEKHKSLIGRFTRKSVKSVEAILPEEPLPGLLFGKHLAEVANAGEPIMAEYAVPAFIVESFKIIMDQHTETEGIFRLSGSLTEIKSLKKKIDFGSMPPFDDDVDVNCLTGLIKMYLRELPEPLLTYNLYDCWKSVSECEDKDRKQKLVKSLFLALPRPNYALLSRLMIFFAELATFEKTTKMGLVNLATLIGPNLIWSPQKDSNDISTPMKITWFMLSHYKSLFMEMDGLSTELEAVGRVKYDFDPEEACEVMLRAGEIVFVTGSDGDSQGWMEGLPAARSNAQGKFPAKYFEPIYNFRAAAETSDSSCSTPPPSSTSLSASADGQLDGLCLTVEELKRSVNEERSAREAVEGKMEALQKNFDEMVQIMITLKNKLKAMRNEIDELNAAVFEDELPPSAPEE